MAKGKNGKRKNGKAKGGMSKRLERQVRAVAKEAVEDIRETKYVSDLLNNYVTYNSASSEVDTGRKIILAKIPFVVPEGDDYKSRDGDKILATSLILRFRVKPLDYNDMIAIGQVDPGTSMFPKSVLNMHVLRVDKSVTLTGGDIDACIKRPQELWVDNRQASGKAVRKVFTIVGKFNVETRYRDIVGINGQTIPAEATLLRVPQITFLTKRFKLNKVTTFNSSSSDEPVQYDYYLYGTWGRWNRGTFELQRFPEYLQMWKTFLFKDM